MVEDFYAIENYRFIAKNLQKNLIVLLNNNDHLGRIWIINSDDRIAGYVALTFGFSFEYNGLDAFVDEFFIKKPFRNKGLEKNTIEFLNQQAKILGVHAIHLEVEIHNEKANRFYLQNGFRGNKRSLLTKMVD